MKNLTLEHIAEACHGVYHGADADRKKEISAVTTDSRSVPQGSLFAAIVGERADGHRFIADVFAKGALAVLCEKEPQEAAGAYILVESTLQALKDLAEYYRQQLDIKVIGITGSVGKTSTKEIVAAVLSEKFRVLKTEKNFNNELGLPLTVFRLREEHEAAVLEMGINHFGEMHRLSKIARPDICVITNIGTCHLEFLGDRDGVLKAKSEIFDFIAPDGTIVLNGDDDKLAALEQVGGIRPVFFGRESRRDFWATDVKNNGLEGVTCTIHSKEGEFEAAIPIPGEHMVLNGLAAAAVGTALGMTKEEIRRGMTKLEALEGRLHVIHAGGITVVDDCYNANPMSMKASLGVLGDARGPKTAILGDMGELGEDAGALHEEVGRFAAALDLKLCVCTGPLCRLMAETIRRENPHMRVVTAEDVQDVLKHLPEWIETGDTVLIKASHFMHFEKIVEALTKK